MFNLDIELLNLFLRLFEIEIAHTSFRYVLMCVQCVTEPSVSFDHGHIATSCLEQQLPKVSKHQLMAQSCACVTVWE